MIELPRKDDNGGQYVSYSQLKLFSSSPDKWFQRYVIGEEFIDNPFAKFGRSVGAALEAGNFSAFPVEEREVLSKCSRLGFYEAETRYDMGDYYVKGFIDTTDFSTEIIDYKTGGKGKHKQYEKEDYFQPELYAMSLLQQDGVEIPNAGVEFITRGGSYYGGFYVANEPIIHIDKPLSLERFKWIENHISTLAAEMSDMYKKHMDLT